MIGVIVLEPVGISNGRARYFCSFPFNMYKNWTQTELCQRIKVRRGMSHSRPCYNKFRTIKGIFFLSKFWNEMNKFTQINILQYFTVLLSNLLCI
jgi:hypothetical protein